MVQITRYKEIFAPASPAESDSAARRLLALTIIRAGSAIEVAAKTYG